MANAEGEFVPPQQCHVFEPSQEDFKDPLAYIAKIRHVAETTGICKVIPPKDWQPPFVVDVDNFRFTPRVQRLSELEASSRLKLNFLDKIAKFWHLRGTALKIPNVEKKSLDLFNLHRIVQNEGGFHKVIKDRKWFQVAQKLGLPPQAKSLATVLRNHYERILLPYDIFKQTGGFVAADQKPTVKVEDVDTDYVPHEIVQRQNIPPPSTQGQRRSKRNCETVTMEPENISDMDATTESKELKRLAFYGAGPKLPGYSPPKKKMKEEDHENDQAVAHIMCKACEKGDNEDRLLLCDKCDCSFHTFCLRPPLHDIPRGEWRCPKCVANEVLKPKEAFGFEQARQEYTLQEFGEKADRFKRDYFHMPIHTIGTDVVEKQFWKVLSDIHADVTVEYGADLHSAEVGSGFPTEETPGLLPEDREYVTCPWNLNNIANHNSSVLRHVDGDISGMKVPWVYVGMCFSTFCWHNEDHWSYSINYLHWGEPKTWYGVPGDAAEKFEAAMATKAPELFEVQPDLLHQLVTIMNPMALQAAGIPIYRVDQKPGEFILTFPRAYHAGFNQGYNFAEAVNFCPADWLPIGRACVHQYALLNRFCVFSHDELICKMASDPEKIDIGIAAAAFRDMITMVGAEVELRRIVSEWGIVDSERVIFELLPDDERQCNKCKTTCYLSSVTCKCAREAALKAEKEGEATSRMVCLSHFRNLCTNCKPEEHILKYRYTLEELPGLLDNLRRKAESFDRWVEKVKDLLSKAKESKPTLEELKVLLTEANDCAYPPVDCGSTLRKIVRSAENFAHLAQQMLTTKIRTRRQEHVNQPVGRMTKENLYKFYNEIQTVPCTIKESVILKSLIDNTENFLQQTEKFLNADDFDDTVDLDKLKDLTVKGESLEVDLPELTCLRSKYDRMAWLRKINTFLKLRRDGELGDELGEITLNDIRSLLREGVNLAPHRNVETRAGVLQQLLVDCEKHEDWANDALKAKPKPSLSDIEVRLQEALKIPVTLPSVLLLEEAFYKAKDWVEQLEKLTSDQSQPPYIDQLEALNNKSKNIVLGLEPWYSKLDSLLTNAKSWRERASKIFIRKNCPAGVDLLDILSPRNDPINSRGVRINKKEETSVAEAFEAAAKRENEYFRKLRRYNQLRRLRPAKSALDEKHCICHRPFTLNMIQCALCNDFFHLSCVPPSCLAQSTTATENTGNASSPKSVNLTPPKFLCMWCQRGRRPKLETILSLLLSLQSIPVRVVEGEALQWLTDHAMIWQNKANQALQSKDVQSAMLQLEFISAQVQRGNLPLLEESYGLTRKQTKKSVLSPANGKEDASKTDGWYYSKALVHLQDSNTLSTLEDLMMDGDLLEVSLEETMHLWKVISATRPNLSALSLDANTAEESPRKRGRKPAAPSEDGKRPRKAMAPAGAVSFSVRGNTDMEGEGEDEDDDDDEEDMCSAESCLRPEGDAVNWVQCDGGCDKWYHMRCVGLPEDHKMDDDFVCGICTSKTSIEDVVHIESGIENQADIMITDAQ